VKDTVLLEELSWPEVQEALDSGARGAALTLLGRAHGVIGAGGVLTAPIAVMDHRAAGRPSFPERHVQRLQRKLRAELVGQCPAHHASRAGVEHGRQLESAVARQVLSVPQTRLSAPTSTRRCTRFGAGVAAGSLWVVRTFRRAPQPRNPAARSRRATRVPSVHRAAWMRGLP